MTAPPAPGKHRRAEGCQDRTDQGLHRVHQLSHGHVRTRSGFSVYHRLPLRAFKFDVQQPVHLRRANDIAKSSGHKTITADGVFKALEVLELEELIPKLAENYEAYMKLQDDKKTRKRTDRGDDASPAEVPDDGSGSGPGEPSGVPGRKRRPPVAKSLAAAKAIKAARNATPSKLSGGRVDGDDVEMELVEGEEGEVGDEDNLESGEEEVLSSEEKELSEEDEEDLDEEGEGGGEEEEEVVVE
ncbi:hypothetical protein BC938DRAFT_484093, partial [Jimgerdemannia flammicorona]